MSGIEKNEARSGEKAAGKESISFCRVVVGLSPKGFDQRPAESEEMISGKSILEEEPTNTRGPSWSRVSLICWKTSRRSEFMQWSYQAQKKEKRSERE